MFGEAAIATEKQARDSNWRAAWERTIRHLLADWHNANAIQFLWLDGKIREIGCSGGIVFIPLTDPWQRLIAAGAPMWLAECDTLPPDPFDVELCPHHLRSAAWGPIVRACNLSAGHQEPHEFETLEVAAIRHIAEKLHVPEDSLSVLWVSDLPRRIVRVAIDGSDIGEGLWSQLLVIHRLPMVSWGEALEASRDRRRVFLCSSCNQEKSWSEGAADDAPEICDACYARRCDLELAADGVRAWSTEAPGDLAELARRIGALDVARRSLCR